MNQKIYILLGFLILFQHTVSHSSSRQVVVSNSDTIVNSDDNDLLIVGTADGFIRAIDSSNNEKWNVDTGGPIASAFNSDDQPYSVLPSVDGTIYIHNREGMTKTSVKARMIAEKAPFISSQDNLIFTGQKTSKILGVDLSNGKITHDSSLRNSKLMRHHSEGLVSSKLDPGKSSLWLGRTDYSFRAFDRSTGREHFNMTFSEVQPLSNLDIGSSSFNDDVSESQDNFNFNDSDEVFNMLSPIERHVAKSSKALTLPPSKSSSVDRFLSSLKSPLSNSPIISAFALQSIQKSLSDEDIGESRSHFNVHPLRLSTDNLSQLPKATVVVVKHESGSFVHEFKQLGNKRELLPAPKQSVTSIENEKFSPSLARPHSLISKLKSKNIVGKLRDDSASSVPNALSLLSSTDLHNGKDDDDELEDMSDEAHIASQRFFEASGRMCLPLHYQGDGTDEELRDGTFGDLPSCLHGNHRLLPAIVTGQNILLPHFIQSTELTGQSVFDETSSPRKASKQSVKEPLTLFRIVILFGDFLAVVLIFAVICLGLLYVLHQQGFLSTEDLRLQYVSILSLLRLNDIMLVSSVPAVNTPTIEAVKSAEFEEEFLDENGLKCVRAGSILISSTVLGYGSSGTVVFRGSLNGRAVAVKRLLTQFNWTAEREIGLLIKSDGHPNVVRYFLSERRGDFVYLCLQLCSMSLRDFVSRLQHLHQSQGPRSNMVSAELISTPLRRALRQVAEGLAHLHAQRIIHRDIKPHNILCAPPEPESAASNGSASSSSSDAEIFITELSQLGDYVLKISDMGLSKQLTRDQESVSGMSFSIPNGEPSLNSKGGNAVNVNPVGTIGWQAPELIALRGTMSNLNKEVELNDSALMALEEVDEISKSVRSEASSSVHSVSTSAENISGSGCSTLPFTPEARARFRPQNVDIFSLGCVFYYVLTEGSHPFGQWYEREANIMLGRCDVSPLQAVPDALDLVTRMIAREPRARPSAKQVCYHPFFWPSQRRLEFFVHLSDRLEIEPPDAPAVLFLEADASSLLGRGWDRKLDPELLEDMGRYRKYDSCSVRDLLRVIRNKRSHYNELSSHVKSLVGELPEGFVMYFETKFPRLLMHCVRVACTYYAMEKDLTSYCDHIGPLFRSNIMPNPVQIDSNPTSNSPAIVQPVLAPQNINLCTTSTDPTSFIKTNASDYSFSDSNTISLEQSYQLDVNIVEPPLETMVSDDEATAAAIAAANAGNVVVWHDSGLALTCKSVGWWRDDISWIKQQNARSGKPRPSHLQKSSTDPKYRSRLCTHWELYQECQFRKKGKCDFAHGPLELRVKDTRRDKWGYNSRSAVQSGKSSTGTSSSDVASSSTLDLLRCSGGEDVLGAARSIEKIRANDGPNVAVVDQNDGYRRSQGTSYAHSASKSQRFQAR